MKKKDFDTKSFGCKSFLVMKEKLFWVVNYKELYSSCCIFFRTREQRFFAVLEGLFRFSAKFSGSPQSFRNWHVLRLRQASSGNLCGEPENLCREPENVQENRKKSNVLEVQKRKITARNICSPILP